MKLALLTALLPLVLTSCLGTAQDQPLAPSHDVDDLRASPLDARPGT